MSEQEQQTPGPWRLIAAQVLAPGASDFLITDAGGNDGLHIAEVFQYQSHESPNGPAEANARLIAASPQLLRALEDVVAQRGDWLGAANSALAQARPIVAGQEAEK